MDKRPAEAEASAGAAAQAKKIKVEHAPDEGGDAAADTSGAQASPRPPGGAPPAGAQQTPRSAAVSGLQAPPGGGVRASPVQVPGALQSPATGAGSGLSNLDRLANIAAHTQRNDLGGSTPLSIRTDTSSLLQTPTGSGTPTGLLLALQQRLNAMHAQQQQQQQQLAAGHPPGQSTPGSAGAGAAQPDFDKLVDVMGFSGVDLRAEEAYIQLHDPLWEDSSRLASNVLSNSSGAGHGLYLNVYPLASLVNRVARRYGLQVDAATLDYLSVATRMRFRNLLESMVRVSRHRAWTSNQRTPAMVADAPGAEPHPVYHEAMVSNPVKQLAAIEKAERIEEGNWRRMRLEREEAEAAEAAAAKAAAPGEEGAAQGAQGASKKSKRPPGVSSRNLSEDVRKRLADNTAMRHLGGNSVTSKYSWLQSPGLARGGSMPRKDGDRAGSPGGEREASGGEASSLPKPKFAPMNAANARRSSFGLSSALHTGAWSDVAMRQAAQREQERAAKARVTLRDALFALEREQAGGAGRGSGQRALYVAEAYGRGRRP